MRLRVEIATERRRLQAVAGRWEQLLTRSAADEPTLSPLWLLTWWNLFGAGRALRCALFWHGDRLAGLAPLSVRRAYYRPGLPVRRLELLATGEDEADEICSDYVGVVAEHGFEQRVAQALAEALGDGTLGRWDELVLERMSSEAVMPSLLAVATNRFAGARLEVTSSSPYAALPATWDEYLARLSSSGRYLLRRSLRDFDRWARGRAQVHVATDRDSLELGRRALYELHRERWREGGNRDGYQGVFGSRRFRSFHEAVMPRLLARGALELSWVTVDGEPVAALYNLVWNDKIYFYQSGRRVGLPAGVRPGIVAHAWAIQRAIEAGRREYDFLAGTSRYKLLLSTAVRPMGRLVVSHTRRAVGIRRASELSVSVARRIRGRVARASAGIFAGGGR
jgi:CelD/BcsL family acetyltransferase involved in cellulose biosynthesis